MFDTECHEEANVAGVQDKKLLEGENSKEKDTLDDIVKGEITADKIVGDDAENPFKLSESYVCAEEVYLWLDGHWEEFEDYFLKRADLSLINKWLNFHGYKNFQDYVWASRKSQSGSSSHSSFSSGNSLPMNSSSSSSSSTSSNYSYCHVCGGPSSRRSSSVVLRRDSGRNSICDIPPFGNATHHRYSIVSMEPCIREDVTEEFTRDEDNVWRRESLNNLGKNFATRKVSYDGKGVPSCQKIPCSRNRRHSAVVETKNMAEIMKISENIRHGRNTISRRLRDTSNDAYNNSKNKDIPEGNDDISPPINSDTGHDKTSELIKNRRKDNLSTYNDASKIGLSYPRNQREVPHLPAVSGAKDLPFPDKDSDMQGMAPIDSITDYINVTNNNSSSSSDTNKDLIIYKVKASHLNLVKSSTKNKEKIPVLIDTGVPPSSNLAATNPSPTNFSLPFKDRIESNIRRDIPFLPKSYSETDLPRCEDVETKHKLILTTLSIDSLLKLQHNSFKAFPPDNGEPNFKDVMTMRAIESSMMKNNTLFNSLFNTFQILDISNLTMTILMNATILTEAKVARLYLCKEKLISLGASLLKKGFEPEVKSTHPSELIANLALKSSGDHFYLKAQFECGSGNDTNMGDSQPSHNQNETTIFKDDFKLKFDEDADSLIKECFSTGKIFNLKNPTKNALYNPQIDGLTEYIHESDSENAKIVSMLLVPMMHNVHGNNEIVGVIQVMNKGIMIDKDVYQNKVRKHAAKAGHANQFFDIEDEIILSKYANLCTITFKNAKLLETSRKEFDRNKAFLELLHDLYEEQLNLERGIMKIMKRVLWMLKCEKCKVVIQAKDINSPNFVNRTFEMVEEDDHSADANDKIFFRSAYRKGSRNSLELNVVTTRSSSYHLPIMRNKINLSSNSTISNSIGVEILNQKKFFIGQIVAIDKMEHQKFDSDDEELLKIFAIFCGLVYDKSILYLQMADTNAMKSVLSYHVRTPEEDVEKLMAAQIGTAKMYKIDDIMFDDYSLGDMDMIKAGIRMFIDSKFIKAFKINYRVLCRWFLTTRKNYRKVLYHNWCHAFNVAQTMYSIMKNSTKISKVFTKLEWIAIIVACFSHDLDHRGLNNSYQTKTHSALEQLYGNQATMEYHHFNMAIMILHTEGHNIFSGLVPEEYKNVISNLKIGILATDLNVHFKTRDRFFDLATNDKFDWRNSDHLELLLSMLMSACDLSASFKHWDTQRKAVDLVTAEFYTQGDLEKRVLKIQPIPEMDREKIEDVPIVQTTWLNNVCLPLYENLAKLDPFFDVIVQKIKSNRDTWVEKRKNSQDIKMKDENI
ncbi:uncharacterized protein LOC135930373 isoform X2 [Gordionus sp. m RMFG-2023]|uniref:uncharacterized protein LOC135930373 isoform X2 n=1 Tax=Gordionus sp. m RMFG-2023 TaxID=3053472 RepID=UPI0031FD0869